MRLVEFDFLPLEHSGYDRVAAASLWRVAAFYRCGAARDAAALLAMVGAMGDGDMLKRVVRAVAVAGLLAVAGAAVVGVAAETAEARQVHRMAVAGDPGDGSIGDPTDGEGGDPNDGEDGDPNDGSDGFSSGGGDRVPTPGDPGDGSEASPNPGVVTGAYSGLSLLVYWMLTSW